jgi:hypothetical protein
MKDIVFLEPTEHEDMAHVHTFEQEELGSELEDFFSEYGDQPLSELQEDLNGEFDKMQEGMVGYNKNIQKEMDNAQDELNKEMDDIIKELGKDTTLNDVIPGSNVSKKDFEKDEEEEVEKSYENDRYLPDFMNYINRVYPSSIPKHDGKSMLGCERAMSWLQRLSNDISTNVRNDVDGILDEHVQTLGEVQESILTDILVLKDHMKKLKQMLPDRVKSASSDDEILKVASTPNNMVICISPFIRAITGILINSTVSAGKPFEDVYDYLLEKYEISEREQLEILQVLKDMGQPIFKDRGMMPGSVESKETEESESKLKGVDFVTNYFA